MRQTLSSPSWRASILLHRVQIVIEPHVGSSAIHLDAYLHTCYHGYMIKIFPTFIILLVLITHGVTEPDSNVRLGVAATVVLLVGGSIAYGIREP